MNRSPSTVSRELKRNTAFSGSYQCKIAEQKALNRHSHKYLFKFTSNFEYAEFEKFFLEKFDKRFYGIVATARYIKQTFPNIASPSIRTIFNWIKTRKWKLKPRDRLRIFYKKGGKKNCISCLKINWRFSLCISNMGKTKIYWFKRRIWSLRKWLNYRQKIEWIW
nr:hypothetical protein [Mycoplasmopsis bovis]